MYRLLKVFSIVIMLTITLFSLLVSFSIDLGNKKEGELLVRDSMNVATLFLEDGMIKQNNLVKLISQMELRYNSLSLYFSMDLPTYLEYTLENDFINSNFPKALSESYFEDSQISAMAVDYLASETMYSSNANNKSGNKVTKLPETKEIRLNQPLKDPATFDLLGTFYLTIDSERLTKSITHLFGEYQSHVYIVSDTNNIIYANEENPTLESQIESGDFNFEKNYFSGISEVNGYKILSFVDRKAVLKNSLSWALILFSISLCINGLLLLLLIKLFRGYFYQIEDILRIVKEVSEGEISNRIATADKEAELADISEGINEMLEGMNSYIKKSYELDIKQKEAEFRALQAQINPHFMYNTLEYIRMYAYSEGMYELAKVVYSFASILRNNISEDKMISVKREMMFIEQYVYLYQTRYPENIAYSFKIAEDIEEIEIPKFCLQPLVENYFTHGIDFSRIDNAISVIAFKEKSALIIQIKDNGQGMTEQEILEMNQYLIDGLFQVRDSVGVRNVDERLKIIFGEGYQMTFKPGNPSGLTIVISIDIEGEK